MNIKYYLNTSISHGTLLYKELIPVFYVVLKDLDEVDKALLREITLFTIWNLLQEDDIGVYAANKLAHALDFNGDFCKLYNIEVTYDLMLEYLCELTPSGYYFGSHPENSTDIGFWEVED